MTEEVKKYVEDIKKRSNLTSWQKVQVHLAAQGGLDIPALQLVAEFTGDQQNEVRQGLLDGLTYDQVKSYADPELPAKIMREKRKALFYAKREDERLKKTLQEVEEQLDESRKLSKFLSDSYLASQEGELKDLRRQNENLFRQNSDLMKEIMYLQTIQKELTEKKEKPPEIKTEESVGKEKVPYWPDILKKLKRKENKKEAKKEPEPDILALINNPKLDVRQMAEISEGFKSGLPIKDIEQYANPQLSAEKMQEIRRLLMTLHFPRADPAAGCGQKPQKEQIENEEESFVTPDAEPEEDEAFFAAED